METTPTVARSAKEQFDRQATQYNAQWNSWSEELLDWLVQNADCRPDNIALDVATGTGFTAFAFAPYVRSVVGVDVSGGMLAQAKKRAKEQGLTNVTFLESPAEALPFPDASFDIVTCRVAPHHFLSVPDFLKEVKRVLRPGGRFVLADTSVPDNDPESDVWQNEVEALRDPSHVRNYTPSEWRQFMTEAGLNVDILTSTGGGITLPLTDWIEKAGCTPEQAEAVRDKFRNAPESARRAFQISQNSTGEMVFVWQRVLARATN